MSSVSGWGSTALSWWERMKNGGLFEVKRSGWEGTKPC